MPGSERRRELRRRRHRKKKMELLKKRAENANASERAAIAQKMRELTPGAEKVIDHLGLSER